MNHSTWVADLNTKPTILDMVKELLPSVQQKK